MRHLPFVLCAILLAVGGTRVFGAAPSAKEVADAVQHGVAVILSLQEGPDGGEWPYEGVYRVGGKIPIGYRIGGTSIAGSAIALAPGYREHPDRIVAVERALRFVVGQRGHELMSPDDRGRRYDVRGWGYTYALKFLLLMRQLDAIPGALQDEADDATRFYISAIETTTNPTTGGWNYASTRSMSPFMTGPTLQALFEAQAAGYEVDERVIDRGLDSLDAARCTTMSYVYSGKAREDRPEAIPGSAGRMMVAETTLHLAGRSSPERIANAVDAFIEHWEWFDKRRQQNGTHVQPYGIAPYYFYFAHHYAAQAVEQLPEADRAEYRARLNALLWQNRLPAGKSEGGWNDRVFDRSANYGTSMVIMALMMPDVPAPAARHAPGPEKNDAPNTPSTTARPGTE